LPVLALTAITNGDLTKMTARSEKQSSSIKPKGGHGGKREGAGRRRGIPNKVTIELAEAAKEFTPQALETLRQVCENGQSEAARVAAACALLDRGYGRPKQAVEHAGKDAGPIQVQAQVTEFLQKLDEMSRRQKETEALFEADGKKSHRL
jgi:hypothetical protein